MKHPDYFSYRFSCIANLVQRSTVEYTNDVFFSLYKKTRGKSEHGLLIKERVPFAFQIFYFFYFCDGNFELEKPAKMDKKEDKEIIKNRIGTITINTAEVASWTMVHDPQVRNKNELKGH